MPLHIDDLPTAIREMKRKLRHELPNYQQVFKALEADIARQIETIRAEQARGENPVPQIHADDIMANRIS
ncbi:YbiU family protein, partial [Atlantibacter hermannii]